MIFEDKETTDPNMNLFLNDIIVLSYHSELKKKGKFYFFNFETVSEKSLIF